LQIALLAVLLGAALGSPARADDSAETERCCFRVPRQEFAARVGKVGVFRLDLPEKLEVSLDTQRDLERWLVSELVTGGVRAETPNAVQSIWDGVQKKIRPRLGGAQAAGAPAWSQEMAGALRIHGLAELRRQLAVDAVVVPSLVVVPAAGFASDERRWPAAVCLVARAIDLDGTLLYRGSGCFGVVEKVEGGELELSASARALDSVMRRRYVVASALHLMLGRPPPEPADL
jgi:hypothetical protein